MTASASISTSGFDPGRLRIDDRDAREHVRGEDALAEVRGRGGEIDPGVHALRHVRVGGAVDDRALARLDEPRDRRPSDRALPGRCSVLEPPSACQRSGAERRRSEAFSSRISSCSGVASRSSTIAASSPFSSRTMRPYGRGSVRLDREHGHGGASGGGARRPARSSSSGVRSGASPARTSTSPSNPSKRLARRLRPHRPFPRGSLLHSDLDVRRGSGGSARRSRARQRDERRRPDSAHRIDDPVHERPPEQRVEVLRLSRTSSACRGRQP